MLQTAQGSSATIYTIGIYDETDADRNPGVLKKLAAQSGGRAYFPHSLNHLDQVWREIAGDIRSQYTIGYSSTNSRRDGMFRRVKISANQIGGRSFRVTSRTGYTAPSETAVPK